MGDFFPLDSHPIVCFIICEIHGFPHQFPRAWKNAAKSIEFPGKLVTIFSPLYEYFCSIRFPSNLILYHMGNAWLCLSISNSTGKYSKIPLWVLRMFFHSIIVSDTWSKIRWFLKKIIRHTNKVNSFSKKKSIPGMLEFEAKYIKSRRGHGCNFIKNINKCK